MTSVCWQFTSANVSKSSLHENVRQARLAKHLTQAQLAQRVGCTQSAISHFENGDFSALSQETLQKIQTVISPDREAVASSDVLAFCPNPDCSVALTLVNQGSLAIRPAMYRITSKTVAVHCKICGSLLEYGCRSCLTPLVDGALFCVGCGTALVEVPAVLKSPDPEGHAEIMLKRLTAYLGTRAPTEHIPTPIWPNAGQNEKPVSL